MIIALSGWKQSGKDTLAERLILEQGYVRLSFADTLKEMVSKTYDIPLEWCHSNDKKETPLSQYPVRTQDAFGEVLHDFMWGEYRKDQDDTLCHTPRSLLILEGSVKRSVTSDFWVKTVVSIIKANPNNNYVITDVRYRSEMKQLKEEFDDQVKSIRVNRFADSPSDDPSERDLDNFVFDRVIENTGTLEDLYKQADNLEST